MSDKGSVGAARGCSAGCTNIIPFTDGQRCGRPVVWEWVPPPRLADLTDSYGVKEARYCDACHGRIADGYPEWTKRRIASVQPPAGPSDAPAAPAARSPEALTPEQEAHFIVEQCCSDDGAQACWACIADAIRAAESRGAKARDAEWRDAVVQAYSIPPRYAPLRALLGSDPSGPPGSPSVPAAQPKDQETQGAPTREAPEPPDPLTGHERDVMEAWRTYFCELCDVLFPESIGQPALIGWKHVIAKARELVSDGPRAAPTPALTVDAAADERMEQLRASQPPERTREAPEPGGALDGVAVIAAERKRQIEKEGWTPAHDDDHSNGDLAVAAACYAAPGDQLRGKEIRDQWPWDDEWWKPGDRIRELAKAGALIAAEIDRLQRASDGPRAAPSDSAPATPGLGTQEGLEALRDLLRRARPYFRAGLPGLERHPKAAALADEYDCAVAGPREAPPSPDSPSQGERKQQLLGGPAARSPKLVASAELAKNALRRALSVGFDEGSPYSSQEKRAGEAARLCEEAVNALAVAFASDKPAAGPSSPSSAPLESGGGTLDTNKAEGGARPAPQSEKR